MINENDLLEPRKAYETVLKDEIKENANKYFDDLVAKSGINVELNQETIREYNNYKVEAECQGKILSKKRGLSSFLVIASVIMIIASLILFVSFIPNQDGDWKFPVLGIVTPIILVAVAITLFIINGKKIRPIIKNQQQVLARINAAVQEKKTLGEQQMVPLNNLYTWNMHVDIVNNTIPLLKLDKFFDFKRLQYLMEYFGFNEKRSNDVSTVHVQSGEILGNPFVIETLKVMNMGTYTYTGSRTITYTVRVPNGGKNSGYHSETRTQTLTASITKPKPYYNYEKFLYYGCDAAPELNFSRSPSGIKGKDEKAVKKYIAAEEKKLDKLTDKNSDKGFTPLANKQFETLFHAWDRNNEVQFRLLFTPLAQKNYVELIKNNEPFGDDFSLTKTGKINKVRTEHSQYVDYTFEPSQFNSFSIDEARSTFVNAVEKYFKSFFFDMAALISIPLYQQYPTDDYIFNKKFEYNNTMFENEAAANAFNPNVFKPKDCATDQILKTSFVRAEGPADRLNVVSHCYKAIQHTDFIPVLARDGRWYDVKVDWIEYIKINGKSQIEVIHKPFTRPELNKVKNEDEFRNLVNQCALNGEYVYSKEYLAFLTNEQKQFDEKTFSSLFKDNAEE